MGYNYRNCNCSYEGSINMSGEIKLDNFQDLLEVVQLQNFDELTKANPQFKKAVKVSGAPKKAVLVSKAPLKKIKKGNRFTDRKKRLHGNKIYYTNAKNSIKRAQKMKSRKGRQKK